MHIVEYLDKAGNPTGKFAKRYEEKVEIEREVEVLIPAGSGGLFKKVKVKRMVKESRFRDETIPIKRYCICDAAGNIVSVEEVFINRSMEISGADHCFELKPGQICFSIDAEWGGLSQEAATAGAAENQVLGHIHNRYRVDMKTKKLKRKR